MYARQKLLFPQKKRETKKYKAWLCKFSFGFSFLLTLVFFFFFCPQVLQTNTMSYALEAPHRRNNNNNNNKCCVPPFFLPNEFTTQTEKDSFSPTHQKLIIETS